MKTNLNQNRYNDGIKTEQIKEHQNKRVECDSVGKLGQNLESLFLFWCS